MNTSRTYPLELILCVDGKVELVNAEEETLWSSDDDDAFREEFSDEILLEEDSPKLLDFLRDEEIITKREWTLFDVGTWDVSIETLDDEDDDEPEDFPDDDGGIIVSEQ